MKKFFTIIICLFIFIYIGINLFPNKKEEKKLKKIRVAEVAHSVFYAPMYVAYQNNYFKDEGLDVEITLTSGADKVTAAVLSNDVEIGFCGSEATIYLYNEGVDDYLVNFAGLTKKDGSFLVSRKKINNFTINDLKGKTIIGGRIGGMPAMTLEWALKENGVNTKKDVIIDTSISFSAMSGAFISGIGDFVTLFEPNALKIEQEGYGYVVASIGKLGGVVPYTTFNAKKSYIDKNPDIIKKFTKAIQRGLDFVHEKSSSEIAKAIILEFPDTNISDLTNLIERHKKIDSWYTTTYINEKDFNHIQEIIDNSGQLKEFASYKDLVITKYSKKE